MVPDHSVVLWRMIGPVKPMASSAVGKDGTALDLDLVDEFLAFRGQFWWHHCVGEIVVESLALVGRPPKHARQCQSFGLIGHVTIDEQPGARANWVGIRTRRIDDAEAEVSGNHACRARGRCAYGVQACVDEGTGGIPDQTVADPIE